MSADIQFLPPRPLPTPATNGLGVAGFVVSLASLLTCGLTSPIGLLLSLFALRKRPRGMAVAGALIGGLQTALLAGVVLMTVSTGQAVHEHYEYTARARQTREQLQQAREIVERHRATEQRLPEGVEGNKLVVPLRDAWGEALRFDDTDDGYVIRSAGPDGQFETPDDLTTADLQPASRPGGEPADLPRLPRISVN